MENCECCKKIKCDVCKKSYFKRNEKAHLKKCKREPKLKPLYIIVDEGEDAHEIYFNYSNSMYDHYVYFNIISGDDSINNYNELQELYNKHYDYFNSEYKFDNFEDFKKNLFDNEEYNDFLFNTIETHFSEYFTRYFESLSAYQY